MAYRCVGHHSVGHTTPLATTRKDSRDNYQLSPAAGGGSSHPLASGDATSGTCKRAKYKSLPVGALVWCKGLRQAVRRAQKYETPLPFVLDIPPVSISQQHLPEIRDSLILIPHAFFCPLPWLLNPRSSCSNSTIAWRRNGHTTSLLCAPPTSRVNGRRVCRKSSRATSRDPWKFRREPGASKMSAPLVPLWPFENCGGNHSRRLYLARTSAFALASTLKTQYGSSIFP